MRIPRKIKKKLKVKRGACPKDVRVTCNEVSAGNGRYYGKYSFTVEFLKK